MELKRFEHSLKIGLGRVIQHLQQYSAAPYQDAILNACLHNTTYDPQVEGFKTAYLMEIIDLTPRPEFYYAHIREAAAHIGDETDDRDACQLVELTSALAQRGDAQARQILYQVFLENLMDENTLGATAIIEVDGAAGFNFVADKLGELRRSETEPATDSSVLLFTLEEVLGEAAAHKALAYARKSNPNIDYYLTLLETQQHAPPQSINEREVVAHLSYEKARSSIESGSFFRLRDWVRGTSEQNLRQAAQDLLEQQDPQQILRCLRIFQHRPFPLDPQLLFQFMDLEHPQFSIPRVVLSALANIEHSSVRTFGLGLIQQGRFSGAAVRLLTHMLRSEDWALIESLSAQELDDETYHDLTWSVQDIFKQHPDSQATATLLNLYTYGPCSTCRERILLMLKSIGELSQQIREECLYDSNHYIRAWARSDFVER